MKLAKFGYILYLTLQSNWSISQCNTSPEFSEKLKTYDMIAATHPFFNGRFFNEYDTSILNLDLKLLEAEINLINAIKSDLDFVFATDITPPYSYLPYIIMHNEFWNNDSLNFLNKHPELSDIGEILLKLHSDYSKLLSAKSRNSYYRKALNFFNQEIGKVYLFTDDNNAMRIKVNFKKRLFNYSNFEIYVIAKYSCGYIF